MRKSLVLMCALTFVLCFVGRAEALLYTQTVNLGGEFHQGFEETTYNWFFTTPSDFEVPYDRVNSANVSVYVSWIDTVGDDYFNVGTKSIGLNTNTATYDLDIGDLFISWPNGNTVNCSLVILEDERTIGHPEWNGDLILGDAKFNLDYDNVAPVPEPATMAMLGMGILGLFGLKRKA